MSHDQTTSEHSAGATHHPEDLPNSITSTGGEEGNGDPTTKPSSDDVEKKHVKQALKSVDSQTEKGE